MGTCSVTGSKIYFVAEIGANHNQSYDKAVELINAAGASGADAVKVQLYTPDDMTIDHDLRTLYLNAYTPEAWISKLQAVAAEEGLDFIVSIYNKEVIPIVERIEGIYAYKVASFEIPDLDFIGAVAKTGKLMVVSTGMADRDEIDRVVDVIRNHHTSFTLMKCTSAYPAPYDEMNIATIPDMAGKYRVPIGLSDHSLGIISPIMAVAFGATIIEKHFMLANDDLAIDSAFSLDPMGFREMVEAVKNAVQAIGVVKYGGNKQYRRARVAVCDISEGDYLTDDNTKSLRARDEGTFDIPQQATQNYKAGELIEEKKNV